MKIPKIIILVLALSMLTGLCACSVQEAPPSSSDAGQILTKPSEGSEHGQEETVPVQPNATEPQSSATAPDDPADANIPWTFGESPVPERRTGIKRQGFSSQKYYEYTESGVYFITFSDSMLLYADYGSDEFIPVCVRPDCPHNDVACDAWILQPIGICSYGGNMYLATTSMVYKTNAAFTDRDPIFSISTLGAYSGLGQCEIWNGVLNIGHTGLDASGNQVFTPYYYKLDGSMVEAHADSKLSLAYGNDGDAFLGYTIDPETGVWGIDLWNPETNTATYLCDVISWDGYYGTEYAVVRQDSVICSYTYADSKITPILDTGLDGELYIHCFPDCIVVSQDKGAERYLHFYNWSFENLGSVKLDFPIAVYSVYDVICGETDERIILSNIETGTPQYYIEKADFGTGNIKLHEYILPELDLYDQARAEAEKNQS